MIKKTDKTNSLVTFESRGFLDGFDSAKRHAQIIQSGRKNKLVVISPETRRLRIIKHQLKVLDRVNRLGRRLRQQRKQFRMMASRNRRLVYGVRAGCRRCGINLLVDQPGDGTVLRLAVEFESFILCAIEVDCEGWDTEEGFFEVDEAVGDVL